MEGLRGPLYYNNLYKEKWDQSIIGQLDSSRINFDLP